MEVLYGHPGTLHRDSVDAREVLQAEMNNRDVDGADRDIEAAQSVAGKMYGERRKLPVMGKVVLPTAPVHKIWRIVSSTAKQSETIY